MQTLDEAIAARLCQAPFMGVRLSRRVQIEIAAGHANLTMGYDWIDPKSAEQTNAADRAELVNMADMPAGVSCRIYTWPDDTRDMITIPSEDDLRQAAASLGRKWVDRGERSDGATIYWLVK